MSAVLRLDGRSLTVAQLARVARDPSVRVEIDPPARRRAERSAALVERIVAEYRPKYEAWRASGFRDDAKRPTLDYGLTTGFGEFKNIPIAPERLTELQENILRSHASGAGRSADEFDPSNYYPAEVVRAALAVRLNAFLLGHSGVRGATLDVLLEMLHAGVVPLVPLHGSVGSSGDLCPLAHTFATLLGVGRFYVVAGADGFRCEAARWRDAGELASLVPSARGWKPAVKEGLALTNGATYSAAMLALAVHDAEQLAGTCDVALALALEAVQGCTRAFDAKVHAARGLAGQMDSAANVRALLAGSQLVERYEPTPVQDVYSLRCGPAVHGATRDAIAFAKWVVERELNAATDNPLLFPGDDGALHSGEPFDARFAPPGRDPRTRASYSAGNFHGQPVGIAADLLAIGVAELADISERRAQMLLDAAWNRGLPANLTPDAGVNSGLMITQYCAASIVSENKVLAHPASVDSIPTSANSEDHVAMATAACRKLRQVLANAQAVLAIELVVGAQAVEWRVLAPKADLAGKDALARIAALAERDAKFRRGVAERARIGQQLGAGSRAAYACLRATVEPVLADRRLDDDLRKVRALVENGALLRAVEGAVHLHPIGAASIPCASRGETR